MKFTDQMGRVLEFDQTPRRIVSLVPSQTEFLFHLGLEDEVVGITKFCIHPESWWRNKKRVGGTKNAKYERVEELQPDFIIGNKEENDQDNITALSNLAPVWMSDISNLEDAYDMMLSLGTFLGKAERAKEIVEEIQRGFLSLVPQKSKTVLYFIWKNPWMLAGQGTFISDLLDKCGWVNQAKNNRYPIWDKESGIDCDFIFLSSEPYPFKEKDKLELQTLFPKAQIIRVDGEMFSWYGSRLLEAPTYFKRILTSVE